MTSEFVEHKSLASFPLPGKYQEGESRYSLSNAIVKAAAMVHIILLTSWILILTLDLTF